MQFFSNQVVMEKDKESKKQLQCVRQVMNFSSVEGTDRFDKPRFDPSKLKEKLSIYSPKMVALFNRIEALDKSDYKKHDKLYKHFIFSDLKQGYGAKILASAFIAVGYDIVMKSTGSKIVIDQKKLNTENEAKFAVLSSTALWNTPVNQTTTKEVLTEFNKRPDNIYGDAIRFIILDSGFKEGIDLFDIKYVHIFEDQLSEADLTQSVGRATRFCGQKGLKFDNGWKLNVNVYKSVKLIPRDILNLKFFEEKEPVLDFIKKQNKELQYNINFESSISSIIKESAVDKHLNENINSLKKVSKFKQYFIPIAIGALVGASAITGAVIINRRKRSRTNKENIDSMMKKFGKNKIGFEPVKKVKFQNVGFNHLSDNSSRQRRILRLLPGKK